MRYKFYISRVLINLHQKNVKKVLYTIIFLILVYLSISVFKTVKTVKPIIKKNVKLTYKQKITDTLIIFLDTDQNIHRLNINKGINIIHFWDYKKKSCIKELSQLNEYYAKGSHKNKIITASINKNIDSIKWYLKNYNIEFPVFIVDTSLLPFKYKNIDCPYTIITDSGKFIKGFRRSFKTKEFFEKK